MAQRYIITAYESWPEEFWTIRPVDKNGHPIGASIKCDLAVSGELDHHWQAVKKGIPKPTVQNWAAFCRSLIGRMITIKEHRPIATIAHGITLHKPKNQTK